MKGKIFEVERVAESHFFKTSVAMDAEQHQITCETGQGPVTFTLRQLSYEERQKTKARFNLRAEPPIPIFWTQNTEACNVNGRVLCELRVLYVRATILELEDGCIVACIKS